MPKNLVDNNYSLDIPQLGQISFINDSPVISELFDAAKLVLKTFHKRTGLSMSEEFALDKLYQALTKTHIK